MNTGGSLGKQSACEQALLRVGGRLRRWEARLVLCRGAALVGAWWVLAGFLDLFVAVDRPGRFVSFALWLSGALVVGWLVLRILKQRHSPEGVAAEVERAFPEMDNRLINYIQFARDAARDVFKAAYVAEGAPPWQELELAEMKDRSAHRKSGWALAGVMGLLLLPVLFFGSAWPTAVWRMVNPFSAAEPVTLTRIVRVTPGDHVVLRGDSILLQCEVQGFAGHEVRVEVHPADADKTTYALGNIESDGVEEFARRIPRATTDLKYRFRAGDAQPSDWYSVEVQSPPALTGLLITVTPPAYTGLEPFSWGPNDGPLVTPEGAVLTVRASCNAPLKSMSLARKDAGDIPFTATGKAWEGKAVVGKSDTWALKGVAESGLTFSEPLNIQGTPDRAPRIVVTEPAGQRVLPVGERPHIVFRVEDEFGVADVRVEEVALSVNQEGAAQARASWTPNSAKQVEEAWRAEAGVPRGRSVGYRIVATDNRPDHPGETKSTLIVFRTLSQAEAEKQRDTLERAAVASLKDLVDRQELALGQMKHHRERPTEVSREAWQATLDLQNQVRTLARELLSNPVQPLGRLTGTMKGLFVHEMAQAVQLLEELPASSGETQAAKVGEAIELQEDILRKLTPAEAAVAKAELDRRVAGLTMLLQSLIREQARVLKETEGFVATEAEVSDLVIDSQDILSEDLTVFRDSCKKEAEAVRGSDDVYADVLEQLAVACDERKIREDMVLAAERLDEGKPADAVPLQQAALADLRDLEKLFGEVRFQQEEEERVAMHDAAAQAKEKIAKVRELHEKMLEALEQVRGQEDKNDEMVDMLEEAYEEIVKNSKEALLEVPNDLHIFMDLNVANDIVEDVFTVFEEVEQVAESEHATAEDFVDRAFAKEEVLLEMMEEAEERIDDVETWLGEKPDANKVTTEAFDQEEMPEAGMALGALATEAEDLIGELMDEPEELNEAADDGATNHGIGDMETGWEVMEGNIATFSAKGKSGNQTPDHKEQDGRSNVGRQGMSVGETAAGSGTINEGDKNIEERRTEDPTQSGQVDLDGEADTNATGGGKLATGKADELGMTGGVERMDSTEEGSWEGMAALMARQADALHAKASLKNVRVDDLKTAARHLRQSADAIARGDIRQAREFRKLAMAALERAHAELEAGPSGGMDAEARLTKMLEGVVEGGADEAPPKYREAVSEYFKQLNESF